VYSTRIVTIALARGGLLCRCSPVWCAVASFNAAEVLAVQQLSTMSKPYRSGLSDQPWIVARYGNRPRSGFPATTRSRSNRLFLQLPAAWWLFPLRGVIGTTRRSGSRSTTCSTSGNQVAFTRSAREAPPADSDRRPDTPLIRVWKGSPPLRIRSQALHGAVIAYGAARRQNCKTGEPRRVKVRHTHQDTRVERGSAGAGYLYFIESLSGILHNT